MSLSPNNHPTSTVHNSTTAPKQHLHAHPTINRQQKAASAGVTDIERLNSGRQASGVVHIQQHIYCHCTRDSQCLLQQSSFRAPLIGLQSRGN